MRRGGRHTTDRHQSVRLKVAERIYAIMKDQGFSQKELARTAKCGEMTVSRVLRAENTSVNVLVDIATALNSPLHHFFL